METSSTNLKQQELNKNTPRYRPNITSVNYVMVLLHSILVKNPGCKFISSIQVGVRKLSEGAYMAKLKLVTEHDGKQFVLKTETSF